MTLRTLAAGPPSGSAALIVNSAIRCPVGSRGVGLGLQRARAGGRRGGVLELTGQATQREAAARFGVDRSTVVQVCRTAKQGALAAASVPGRPGRRC